MTRRVVSLPVILLLIAGLMTIVAAPPARALGFAVDVLTDAVDATLDGVCDDGAGNCTLRAAIQEANDSPGPHTIVLPAGTVTLSIAGTGEDAAATGDLDVTTEVTITGNVAGTTIDGAGVDRVFDVQTGGTLTLANLTLTGGVAPGVEDGGAVRGDTGSAVVADGVTFTGNSAGGAGGAVAAAGTLNSTNSTYSANVATGDGGAIITTGTTVVNNVTVTGNTADNGGGLAGSGSTTIGHTIVAGNTGTTSGADCSGTLTSGDFNLVGVADGPCSFTPLAGDLTGTTASPLNALIGALADNGGPTFTHGLLTGSPAIDAGDVTCADPDQRGVDRGDVCDIGAFEAILVGFSLAASSVGEGGVSIDVDIELDGGGLDSQITVDVADLLTGTAAASDYGFTSPETVTFPAAAPDGSVESVTVTVAVDSDVEGPETVDLALSSPVGALLGGSAGHTITITDDDVATLGFVSATSATLDESAGLFPVSLVLSLPPGGSLDTTVSVEVADQLTGTAANPDDHSFTSPTVVTFLAGALDGATMPASVTVAADGDVEGDETVDLSLGSPSANATLGGLTAHTLTITDDDSATVSFQTSSAGFDENAGAGTMTVALSISGGGTLADPVSIEVADDLTGTATTPGDYTFTSPGMFTFPAGSSDGTFAVIGVPIASDGDVEPDETVDFSLSVTGGDATVVAPTSFTMTILDDDLPSVGFQSGLSSVVEGVASTDVALVISVPGGGTLQSQVEVTLTDALTGSAVPPGDYSLTSPDTVVFPIGSPDGTIVTVPVTVVADTDVEGDETVDLVLSAPVDAVLGTAAHEVTITDDDVATLRFFAASSATLDESPGLFPVTVELSLPAGGSLDVAVSVEVSDQLTGTAADPGDYSFTSPSVVTFVPGSTEGATAVVQVSIAGDSDVEGDETVDLAVGSPSANATVGGITAHEVTITDDDVASFGFVAASSATTDEAPGAFAVDVELTLPAGGSLDVPVSVEVSDQLTGTAVDPADYSFTNPSVLTFLPGALDGATDSVSIVVADDGDAEDDETVDLALGSPSANATLAGFTAHTVTITDDDTPTVAFESAAIDIGEGAGSATVRLVLSVPGGGTLPGLLTGELADDLTGTASNPDDYTVTSPTPFTFLPGAADGSTLDVAVTIVDDGDTELDETIDVSLSVTSGGSNGSPAAATVTITDDDPATVFFTVASASVGEAAGTATVDVDLAIAGGGTLLVPVEVEVSDALTGDATPAVDYTFLSPTTIVFPIGTPDGFTDSVNVTITQDGDDEPDETVDLTLSVTAGPATPVAPTTHTLTILDDDVTTVGFAAASSGGGEAAGPHAVFVRLDVSGGGVTTSAVEVEVTDTLTGTATSGTDYAALAPATVTFPPGTASGATMPVALDVTDDLVFEGDETVDLTLALVAGPALEGLVAHTATIEDDETTPTISIDDVTSSEIDVDVDFVFTITLSNPVATDVTVDVTVLAGGPSPGTPDVDFATAGPVEVTIPAMTLSETFNASVIGDDLAESTETFLVDLSSPVGAGLGDASGLGTITDDDAVPDAVDDPGYVVDEGAILDTAAEFQPSVLANDLDADSVTLTAVIVTPPTNAVSFALNTDGSFVYEHDGSDGTSVTFTYRADDGTNLSTPATVTISINQVNEAPVISPLVSDQTTDEGTSLPLAVTFTDDEITDVHAATVDWGDGTVEPATVTQTNGLAGTVSAFHSYADNGMYAAQVCVTDLGPNVTCDAFVVDVANVAPSASVIGSPGSSPEGTDFVLTAGVTDPGSDDTFTYSWTVTKDAAPFDPGTPTDEATLSLRPDDNGSYEVTLVVTDDDTEASDPAVATITATNVAPTVTMPLSLTGTEGVELLDAGSFGDEGSADTHTATVDYGEGAGQEPLIPVGGDFTLVHTYADEGPFTITVCVTDDDVETTCESTPVTIDNADPVVTAGLDQIVAEGAPVTLAATFTDTGGGDTHTAEVDWGDGTIEPGIVDPVLKTVTTAAPHVYADNDVFTATVTVTDNDLGVGSDQLSVTVENADLTVTVISSQTIFEGDDSVLSVTFEDAGLLDTHTATVDWGQGGGPEPVNGGADVVSPFPLPDHPYPQDGEFIVSVVVTDDEGDMGFGSATITVDNAVPVVLPFLGATLNEFDFYSSSGTFTDAGIEDTHTATVDYGDGAGPGPLVLSGEDFSLGPHRYRDNGVFTVEVCADDGTDAGCDTATVTVNNVAPDASVLGPSISDEGDTELYAAGLVDVGEDDTHTFAWSVMRNGAPYPTGTPLDEPTLSLTFDDDGDYDITLTITDDDGGADTAVFDLTVNNLAPTASFDAPPTASEGDTIDITSTVTDPGTADTFTYAWTVTKDLAPFGTGDEAMLSFVPDDEGTYEVTLVVTDDDGGAASPVVDTITVENVLPFGSIVTPASAVEGESVTFTALVTDPGLLDVISYDWTVFSFAENPIATGSSAAITFVLPDDGLHFGSVSVMDGDGEPVDLGTSIRVLNAPPEITSIATDTTPNPGVSLPLTIGFTDPGIRDLHSATIDWGDGSGSNPMTVTETDGAGTATASHTYIAGRFTAEACVTDDESAQTCVLRHFNVGGTVKLSSDFNNDTFEDVAIGVPGEAIGTISNAGVVSVIYGSVSGLSTDNDLWHQDSADIPGAAEAGDKFGSALAFGDFDGDGYSDLAVGSANEAIGTKSNAGSVTIIRGGPSGLRSAGARSLHQNTAGVKGVAETGDLFGASLATGDFNKDGFADLAVGVPGENLGSTSDAGMVAVFYGSPSGLSGTHNDSWHQNSAGIKGTAEATDEFGASLTAGDVNEDGAWDLIVGVPGEGIGAVSNAGAVALIRGSSFGLTDLGDQFWSQDSAGIKNFAEAGDRFGDVLSSGDYNNDGKWDVAIGIPRENVGPLIDAGAVAMLRGASGGLTATGDQYWTQGEPGVRGLEEAGDLFGSSLASGDFNGDNRFDLAVGVPREHVGLIGDAGSVEVFYGASGGLSASNEQLWDEDSDGVKGIAEANDFFGQALRAVDVNGDKKADLIIGVPGENIKVGTNNIINAGRITLLPGSPSGLTDVGDKNIDQNSTDIVGAVEVGDDFGEAL